MHNRQTEEEPQQGVPRYGQGEGRRQEEEIDVWACVGVAMDGAYGSLLWLSCLHDLARTRCQPGVYAMGVTRS